MGLFGSLLGNPSKSNSASNSSSTSGFGVLPAWAQQQLQNVNSGIANIGESNFYPLAETADELEAYRRIQQGFSPTAQSISSDIAMQQNPYDQYVLSEINRQAQGANSVLQQNQNTAGQFASNRGLLGANDIDLSRINQIGGFMQGQFNNALNNAVNVLPQLRAADAQGLLGIGGQQRDLYSQMTQAPVNALNAQVGLLGNLGYTVGGSQSNSSAYSKSTGESKGILGGLTSAIGNLWSDERLKKDIKKVDVVNGHNVYEYKYKGDNKKYIGVIAQEIMSYLPEAVTEKLGFLSVNYDMLGINMVEA